jgi:uncharacterized glyoxalase superfamily protein PhnB
MDETFRGVVPALFYRDAFAALDWLERAFGFERSMVITDAEGNLGHAEMKAAGGYLMIGQEWADWTASPASAGGKCCQTVHIQLDAGIDEHCRRAQAAGAVVIRELADQFYGDRTYLARDPEGHVWTFAQTLRAVGVAEMEQASGLKIKLWDQGLESR